MIGELNYDQMNNLLLSQVVGRIACVDGKQPYIVPVTYCYDGVYIYGQTNEGQKLTMLRKNKRVCFEVDSMVNMRNWQSVLVFGRFEEVKGKELERARESFMNHIFPLLTSTTVYKAEHGDGDLPEENTGIKAVMYRIKIEKLTGRFEKE